ncbi:KH domain protein, partial [Ancylostoma duodenale]
MKGKTATKFIVCSIYEGIGSYIDLCKKGGKVPLSLRVSKIIIYLDGDDVTQRMQALAPRLPPRPPPPPPPRHLELVVYERIAGVCDRMSHEVDEAWDYAVSDQALTISIEHDGPRPAAPLTHELSSLPSCQHFLIRTAAATRHAIVGYAHCRRKASETRDVHFCFVHVEMRMNQPMRTKYFEFESTAPCRCKIKALRAKTNTYIKTPIRGEDPVFVVTGKAEDVLEAKREIECAAEHFTQIRASRRHSHGGAPAPGHVTLYVRVPLRVVGLVVGPKGATIKRIQQDTHTYIITPSREREPIFE